MQWFPPMNAFLRLYHLSVKLPIALLFIAKNTTNDLWRTAIIVPSFHASITNVPCQQTATLYMKISTGITVLYVNKQKERHDL